MRKSLRSVYTMHSVTGLASSLIGIFIPAYLISLGYVPRDVFAYYLVYAVAVFCLFVVAALLATRLGVRLMVIVSLPLTVGYIFLLYVLHAHTLPLLVIAGVQGAAVGLYWFGLNSFFAANVESGNVGTSVGKLFGIPQLVGLLGPLVGGLVAVRFGFPALLALGAVVYATAIIPLMCIPELTVQVRMRGAVFANLFQQLKRYTFIEFVENIREELEAIVWPLFIFITFRSALSVGIVGTLAGVGSILFMFLIGHYTDKVNPKIFMRIGAVLMVLIWVARFVSPPLQIIFYTLTVLSGFFACLIEVPFTSFIYTTANQRNSTEFLVYREFHHARADCDVCNRSCARQYPLIIRCRRSR